MRTLIVVDMLNDFINKNGKLYCGKNAENIVPFVKAKIQEFKKARRPIIFLCDYHQFDDKEFERFPAHCVQGTSGSLIIDGLWEDNVSPAIHDDGHTIDQFTSIEKKRYNGFYGTRLAELLKSLSFSHKTGYGQLNVEVVGVCTSICVMDTVGGLANRDYKIRIYKDGVADFDQEAHAFSLKRMEKLYGAEIV